MYDHAEEYEEACAEYDLYEITWDDVEAARNENYAPILEYLPQDDVDNFIGYFADENTI